MKRRLLCAAVALLVAAGGAKAADATGEWARVDGKARVRMELCGDVLCGSITWVKDPKAPGKVGQKVFYDMKANGDGAWSGKAFNPEDGAEYTGKLILSGRSLVTKGCVLGGLICKSVDWTRVN